MVLDSFRFRIVQAQPLGVLGDNVVDVVLIRPPTGLGDEQRWTVVSGVALPHAEPLFQDLLRLLVEEQQAVGALGRRLELDRHPLEVEVLNIQGDELTTPHPRLGQEQDRGAVPGVKDRVHQAGHLLDGDELTLALLKTGSALVPLEVSLSHRQDRVRRYLLLEHQPVVERRQSGEMRLQRGESNLPFGEQVVDVRLQHRLVHLLHALTLVLKELQEDADGRDITEFGPVAHAPQTAILLELLQLNGGVGAERL